MIGRRTTKRLAQVALERFAENKGHNMGKWVPWDKVYDFLFEHEFESAFCNAAETACHGGEREFEEFILKLHTGESVTDYKSKIPLEVAEIEGQVQLRKLANALLTEFKLGAKASAFGRSLESTRHAIRKPAVDALESALELDGYSYKDGRLWHRESAPVDSEKQKGLLSGLARELTLANVDVLEHHLKRADECYEAGQWDDCSSNARKALECVLQEAAAKWSLEIEGIQLPGNTYTSARLVREYLQKRGIITEKEMDAMRANYGLMSDLGSHPNIGKRDEARMLRQIALVLAEYALVTLRTSIEARRKSG
jgi:hypothetical protein